MNVELIELKENADSPYFILLNKKLNRMDTRIGGMKFRYVGQPFDNHRNRMVGVAIQEEVYETELVLDESGILMITKANGDELIKSTREFRSTLTEDNTPPTKKIPVKYQPVVDELIHAFHVLFD